VLKQPEDDDWGNDDAVLALAIETARASSKEAREQIDDFLNGVRKEGFPDEWAVEPRPWREVAEFAAYGCQMRALNLRPADCPPCWAYDDIERPAGSAFNQSIAAARALAGRMLAAGISIFHPDPLAALAAKGK
jgi:hypothetical protein